MASNFDFLKDIDKELFDVIEDAQRLFRDEYFNQATIQVRIYAEKMAKKILGSDNHNLTFDDILNCLKDKIKSDREKEFIDDLFFIKKEGNKAAHGEDISAIDTLETLKRAFEAGINYAYSKKKDDKIDKLQFDETLLVMEKHSSEVKLIDKYLQAAKENQEELLKQKEGEFKSQIEKSEEGFKDKNHLSNASQYKKSSKKKTELTPTQQQIKNKIKEEKKNLKENINKTQKTQKPKKQTTKSTPKKSTKKKSKKQKIKWDIILFLIFVTISLIFVTKMLFFF